MHLITCDLTLFLSGTILDSRPMRMSVYILRSCASSIITALYELSKKSCLQEIATEGLKSTKIHDKHTSFPHIEGLFLILYVFPQLRWYLQVFSQYFSEVHALSRSHFWSRIPQQYLDHF